MDSKQLGLAAATFLGGAAALTAIAVAFGRRQSGGSGNTPRALTETDGPTPAYEQVREQRSSGVDGHAATDLAADTPVTIHSRAPEAFRPDMDAPMTPAEREALRPATGPSPTLVDAGTSMPG